ncbi:glycosyltransferase [Aurantibacillus circumpalustris]|uniref:glycosyltransferase n=1 Tax=Aurantibacillus circumpalustris TaxID=3036359 RepID=UPI00295A8C54|nr:glycosyltransferase [Aurantibacillus circumpalustris]
MSNSLNIVSFDVPFPANYGGVIDVFYKLYWLKKAGVKIHLHCFTYGRNPSKELEDLCEKVYYYERKTGVLNNLSLLPYTVKSRQSAELEKNLLCNDFPILFEVLHTCYLLNDERFKNRKKIYRHSNIEHDYYNELSKTEKRFAKRIYLRIEAWKLKRFESIVAYADLILAVNQKDTTYFHKKYPAVKSVYLASFHPNSSLTIKPGKGDYILFHGNLSVSENYEAAVWLIKHVFSKINFPVVIAGLNPPEFLIQLVKEHSNIKLRVSPNEEEMTQLLRNSQIHVLYTAQPTGLKLKLLNVLFKGRFVICNTHMISGTGIKENKTLRLADSAENFIQSINESMHKDFTDELCHERKSLIENFDNTLNAKKLIEEVF